MRLPFICLELFTGSEAICCFLCIDFINGNQLGNFKLFEIIIVPETTPTSNQIDSNIFFDLKKLNYKIILKQSNDLCSFFIHVSKTNDDTYKKVF